MAGTLLAASVAISACAPGAAAPQAATASAISTAVPTEKVSLTIAHFENGGNGAAIDKLISAYEQKHPNVTIKAAYTSFNDYGKSIKLSMSSDSAPDIAQVGQAYTMQGPLVKAGLLRPLDAYAKAYGWDTRFQAGLLNQSRFQPDGKSFGAGNLYGLALGGNMVGIYYNKATLANLGITVPFNDVAAFDAALAKVKAAGQVPIELGNSEQWPGNHVLSSLIAQYAPISQQVAWVYGKKGATFASPGVTQATTTMSTWAKNGYFDPAANGTSNDDAVARFAKGTGAFFISGNWTLATIEQKMGNNAGFTAVPPATAGAPARATGATTSPFGISTKTQHADVAANFIDFMTRPEAAQTLSAGGYAPVAPGATPAAVSPLQQEFNAVWSKVLADDGLCLYLDWSTTSMGDTLFPGVQELIGDKTTPDKLVTAVQADWVKAHG